MNNNFKKNENTKLEENLQNNPVRVIPTKNKWKSWRVSIFAYMLVCILLFLGTCQGAQMAGWWTTSGRAMPIPTPTGGTVTSNGADPAAIKGSMTIKQVLADYNVTWEEMSKQFNIPADTSLDSPLNTLEKVAPDFSVTGLRTWLTERANK
jgi:hypothetical protein